MVAEATSALGVSVDFPPATSSDDVSAVVVSYSHLSGSLFPLGETAVTATVRDEAGNTRQCGFTVTVRDTTAPVLTCPATVSVETTVREGASVEYPAATATDSVSTAGVRYSQASGAVFPVGDTAVTATATDAAGNESVCTFQVKVTYRPPVQVPTQEPASCGCGASSGAQAGLGWGILLLLSWRGARGRARVQSRR